MKTKDRPPYSVPSMKDIAAIPWNGFNAVSTFSGGGGSSLGYRMAGFRVLWASEFIDEARRTYEANAAPYTTVDGRDIRTVNGSDILAATGLEVGEIDLFDGSPPCSSFSTAGKRQKGWGKVKKYSDKAQRTDDLFFEFTRLIDELQPRTFVAENVSGLVKGAAKGYFIEIMRALKACGYRVTCRVLDAQWLGVPQARQRTIFVGVRDDLGLDPVHPSPLPYRYSIRDAVPWVRAVGGIRQTGFAGSKMVDAKNPCPTILAGGGGMNTSQFGVEAETDISRYAIGREWDRIKPGQKSGKYLSLVKPKADAPCPTITASAGSTSTAGVCHPYEKRKFSIAELKRLGGFPDDYALTGSFAQQWERIGRAVPPVMMFQIASAVRDGILSKCRDTPTEVSK